MEQELQARWEQDEADRLMVLGLQRLREVGVGLGNRRVGDAAGEVTAVYQLGQMARLREAHTALMLELDSVEHRNRLRSTRKESARGA